nr:PREDICTED: retinol dehydrogenase 8-like [Latimeria chalumnae]|eukprot:XP_014345394.1 PREDICTED: retinol dehydrogenase 8-like [Latimeria chalumnae]
MGILRCKSILITGASRGIGFELARQLASESPSVEKVIATCREPEKAKELQELTGKYTKLKIVQLDIVSKESIEKAVKEVEALVGSNGLNCLLNNAGEMIFANLETVTAEAMMRMYETNTVAHLMVSKVSWEGPFGVTGRKGLSALLHRLKYNTQRDVRFLILISATCLQAPLTAKDSASGILSVLANLGEKDTGNFFDWKGEIVPW